MHTLANEKILVSGILLEATTSIWNIRGIYFFLKENWSFARLQYFAFIVCLVFSFWVVKSGNNTFYSGSFQLEVVATTLPWGICLFYTAMLITTHFMFGVLPEVFQASSHFLCLSLSSSFTSFPLTDPMLLGGRYRWRSCTSKNQWRVQVLHLFLVAIVNSASFLCGKKFLYGSVKNGL